MAIQDKDKIIEFYSPSDFKDENFFIPDYQRGYRWTKQEVEDLLNDLKIFREKYPESSYPMQPIVVRYKEKYINNEKKELWEVVDGQQRLTTILLILQVLGEIKYYHIYYEVLKDSSTHISDIKKCPNTKTNNDINLFHMKAAYDTANTWIERNFKEKKDRDRFKNYILNNLRFLWYRADKVSGEDSGEKIFQRLNIGKIALTQSELIKALFLSNELFENEKVNRKEELAHQWDVFESTLQNDEFWYFLTDKQGADSPTRIEFLFRELVNLYPDSFDNETDIDSKDGLFRTYYNIFRKDKTKFLQIWDKAIDFMDITQMWHEDVIFYHLIGFRIIEGAQLKDIITEWKKKTVTVFLKNLANSIAERNKLDLEHSYYDKKDNKRQALPLLLLSNILQVLRQNITHQANKNYAQGVFYKFPFHLYKKQFIDKGQNWDVEHIDSATENELENHKDQCDWICAAYLSLNNDQQKKFYENQKNNLSEFFEHKNDNDQLFKNLYDSLIDDLGLKGYVPIKEKNCISNFALLDFATNRTYQNAIFSTKRQYIRNKECGKLETIEWNKEQQNFKITQINQKSAFVPPCTKDAFMKTYSPVVSTSLYWTTDDAMAYGKYLQGLFDWFTEQDWSHL